MLMTEKFTIEEKEAIEQLKEKVKDELTPRILQDKTIFYRFLKARDFNVRNAEHLLRKHFQDRRLYSYDNILEWYKLPEHSEYIPTTFLGFDKEGSAIRYIDIGGVDMKGLVNIFEFKDLVLFIGYWIEHDMERMTENSIRTGKVANQYVIIFDMNKLNLFHVTFKKGIEYMIKGLELYQNNFPERVKEIYVINASFYFPLIFALLKSALSSAVLQKLHVFGMKGYQEVLSEKIDEKVLPAFLGGKRTDPDGNPLCETFIVSGKKIPEYLYDKNCKKSIKEEEGVKKLTVGRQCRSGIEISIDEPNAVIEWEFELKWGEINFGLYYKHGKENEDLDELIPEEKFSTEMASETGFYSCQKVGTYVVIFDNSDSWMYSKDIYYRIRTINPPGKNCLIN